MNAAPTPIRAKSLGAIPHGFLGRTGGISTGGNVAAALELAKRPEFQGKRIVTIACSFAERYISSALFDGIG